MDKNCKDTDAFIFWYKQSKNTIFNYEVLKSHGGKQQKESLINHAIVGNKVSTTESLGIFNFISRRIFFFGTLIQSL